MLNLSNGICKDETTMHLRAKKVEQMLTGAMPPLLEKRKQ